VCSSDLGKNFRSLCAILTDDIIDGFDESTKITLSMWKDLPEQTRNFIVENMPDFPNVSPERLTKLKTAAEVMNIIKHSPSKEIRRLQNELLEQLWQVDNPQHYLMQILDVFERNNLPLVGKVYRVFEILHPPDKFEAKISSHRNVSPVLIEASTERRYDIVYRDLLKVSIDSGDSNLLRFLTTLKEGQQIIDEIEQNGLSVLEGPESLGKREAAIRFLNRLDVMYSNSNYGRRKGNMTPDLDSLESRIFELKANLGIERDKPILRRISAMFLRPLGYSSIEQVIERMKAVKAEASARNIQFVNEALQSSQGIITLKEGDLLKGIRIQFLDNILNNGSLAKEYLGASADSDYTPFDTDTSIVTATDAEQGSARIIESSAAGSYGDLFLAIRDRGQFQHSDPTQTPAYDRSKYELFYSGIVDIRHFGIRTGIASSEIDAMVAKGSLFADEAELERVFYTIAQNNVYIPVVDTSGKILFTLEDFENYKIDNKLIQDILDKPEYKPEELLDALKKLPFIKRLYEGDTGTWEGYRLDEHTNMVTRQYEKYFADRWKSPFISQKTFRTMLELHDLGKPLAVQITKNSANQHEYTMKFLPAIMERVGLDSREIEVAIAIINQDNLGEYLQGKIDAQTAAANIRTIADDAGVPVVQLFELIKMYYMCDAGAYTEDAGGKASLLDKVFVFSKPADGKGGEVRFSEDAQQKVDELSELLPVIIPFRGRTTVAQKPLREKPIAA